MKAHPPDGNCAIETLIAAISGRWKLLIIYWLLQGPCRFNQLQRNLGSITHRTLTRALGELIEAGFVLRKDYRTIPPHVEYSLTPLGHSLIPVLQAMHDWAADNAGAIAAQPEAAPDSKKQPA